MGWGNREWELAFPRGAFLVVHIGDRPVGCGAVRTLETGTAEIKRMWVDPGHVHSSPALQRHRAATEAQYLVMSTRSPT